MRAAALLIPVVVAAAPPASLGQSAGSPGPLPADAPAVAQACAGCHGAQGEGNPAVGAPRLAAQSAYYLAKQLESYANGSRRDPVMEPIAKELSPQAANEIAAYYAQRDAPAVRADGGKPPERGRVLAVKGDSALGVQACINCHGPGGVGEPPTIPYIAGLHAGYISAELNHWKEGTRRNDAGQQMATVARALSAADMEAVARYYAALPPPKPAPLHLVQAPAPGQKPQPPSPPERVAGEPAQPEGRVGVEQGAPTTGGTEGPGGSGTSGTENGAAPAGGGTAAPEAAKKAAAGGTAWPRVSRRAGTDKTPGAGDQAARGDPARGRAIVASGAHGCPGCHTIPGIRWPQGIVGPPLHGIARRAFIAGQLPNDPATLVAFLFNPPALIPETGMPEVGLTLEEARHVAAFLRTLESSDGR